MHQHTIYSFHLNIVSINMPANWSVFRYNWSRLLVIHLILFKFANKFYNLFYFKCVWRKRQHQQVACFKIYVNKNGTHTRLTTIEASTALEHVYRSIARYRRTKATYKRTSARTRSYTSTTSCSTLTTCRKYIFMVFSWLYTSFKSKLCSVSIL